MPWVLLPLACCLIFVYPWQRLFQYLPGAYELSLPALFMLGLLPVACFYIWARTRSAHTAILGRISLNWLGISLMFMHAALLTELINLAFSPADSFLAVTLLVTGVSLTLYAVYRASAIPIANQVIESPKLERRFRVVQLSDLHLGSRSRNYLARAIDKANSLDPDLMVITGDLIDMSQVMPDSLNILNRLQAPVFFVTGNHDRYVGTDDHFQAIRNAGVEILDNTLVEHNGLQIIGIADQNNPDQVSRILPTMEIDRSKFSLLLYHKPQDFRSASNRKIDLMLSGHTHGGQIFPFNFLVKKQFPLIKGPYSEGSSRLYVSQGTGTWGPVMRLGSHNEITAHELIPLKTA